MAQLDFIDKGYFEKLFGMNSGYVLNFSNSTFQEFVYEKIQIDIYQKYPGLSKAKILRAIIADSDKITIGKLLLELLRYMLEGRPSTLCLPPGYDPNTKGNYSEN